MRDTPRALVALAALNGLLAVGVGAFGAHGLTDPQAKAWVATGAQYGLGHAAAALALGGRAPGPAWAMSLGALIFAAALYALGLGAGRWLGAVAPVGGLLMLGGWLWLLLTTLRR